MKTLKWINLAMLVLGLCSSQVKAQCECGIGINGSDRFASGPNAGSPVSLALPAHVGDEIYYHVTVFSADNNCELENILTSVTFPDGSTVDLDPIVFLEIGGSHEFDSIDYTGGTYIVRAEDVVGGLAVGSANTEGDCIPAEPEPATATNPISTPVVSIPCTEVTISSVPPGPIAPGTIDLVVTEFNCGEDPIHAVSVVVNDGTSDIAILSASTAIESATNDDILEVGETMIWDSTTDASLNDIPIADTTTFTATATGLDPLNQIVTWCIDEGNPPENTICSQLERNEVTVEVIIPCIHIEKATNGQDADNCDPGPTILVGDPVTWTYVVTNCGNVPLSNVVVTDDNGTPGDNTDDFSPTPVDVSPADGFNDGDLNTDNVLDVTEVWLYEASGTAQAGPYHNEACVVGTPPIGDDVTACDPSCYNGELPCIDIEKATNGEDADDPTGPIIAVGDPVTWTYVVTNCGTLPLSNVIVTDDNGTPGDNTDDFSPTPVDVSPADGFNDGDLNTDNVLDLTETWLYEASGTAQAGQYANEACVVGTPPIGEDVTDCDPSHYFGEEPGGVFCTFTQGYYGNAGGKKCGGIETPDLIDALLASGGPVFVGIPGHSIMLNSSDCIIDLLPAGGTPALLPAGDFGCPVDGLDPIPSSVLKENKSKGKGNDKPSRFNNVLIGQIVALTLNLRLYDIDCAGENETGNLASWVLPEEFCIVGYDGCITKHTAPSDFVGLTVGEILAMANLAIAGEDVGVSLSAINGIVSYFNETFDECAEVVTCPIDPVEICDNGCDDDFDGLIDGADPDCQ